MGKVSICFYFVVAIKGGVKRHDWQLGPAQIALGGCVGENSILWLHLPITTGHSGSKWHHQCMMAAVLTFIPSNFMFVQLEEAQQPCFYLDQRCIRFNPFLNVFSLSAIRQKTLKLCIEFWVCRLSNPFLLMLPVSHSKNESLTHQRSIVKVLPGNTSSAERSWNRFHNWPSVKMAMDTSCCYSNGEHGIYSMNTVTVQSCMWPTCHSGLRSSPFDRIQRNTTVKVEPLCVRVCVCASMGAGGSQTAVGTP